MSTWTYGTMTDDERAQLDADIAAEQDPQKLGFLQRMYEIDDEERNTPGVAIVIPAVGDPEWYELGLGVQEATEALKRVLGPTWTATPLFKVIDRDRCRGFENLYMLHYDGRGPLNFSATDLHAYSLNLTKGMKTRGDVVIVSITGPNGCAPDSPTVRFEDVSQRDKYRIGDFGRYVRDNPTCWPKEA